MIFKGLLLVIRHMADIKGFLVVNGLVYVPDLHFHAHCFAVIFNAHFCIGPHSFLLFVLVHDGRYRQQVRTLIRRLLLSISFLILISDFLISDLKQEKIFTSITASVNIVVSLPCTAYLCATFLHSKYKFLRPIT
ncbi:MAG: hypothetical protein JWP81_3918 [Ferruginibacter sp.]|nr:hypothetical protein [Ferruginibacter sp.]